MLTMSSAAYTRWRLTSNKPAKMSSVNLVWSMESGYGIQFQVWVLQTQMTLTSMFCIQSQAWHSIPMLVLNHKFGIGSEFPR